MKKFTAFILASLLLTTAALAEVVHDFPVPATPCVDKPSYIERIVTGNTNVTAFEVGDSVVFTSPDKDLDLITYFNEDKCLVRETYDTKPAA